MKNEKPGAGKSSGVEAGPEQKKKFEQKKSKQMDKNQPQFEPDNDEDTTGKSEVFKKQKR